MVKPTVSDIVVTSLKPVVEPRYEHLVAKILECKHMEFVVNGVSNAVSNGIRRVISTELSVLGLYAEQKDIDTNDEFIIPEFIRSRISLIPVKQNINPKTIFELNVQNSSTSVMPVKLYNLKIVEKSEASEAADKRDEPVKTKALPFSENITLLMLNPGKKIHIKNIRLRFAKGHVKGFGGHVLTNCAASLALDQKPLNVYEKTGIASSVSNPRVWKIHFNTNGTMEPEEIVKHACDNIIERMKHISTLLSTVQTNGNEYILTVNGETDTIGNLFTRTIIELFPEIKACPYFVDNIAHSMTIRIICDEDINTVYQNTIKHVCGIYTEIKKQFE